MNSEKSKFFELKGNVNYFQKNSYNQNTIPVN